MFTLKHVQGIYLIVDNIDMDKSNTKTYVDAFLFGCQVNNLTENSINNYAERLGYFLKYLDQEKIGIENVSRQTIQQYILSMHGKLADASVNGRIQALQRFYNYLVEEGLWSKTNPMHKIKKIRTERKIKNVLGSEDILKVAKTANKQTFIGFRNLTMLLLFWDTMIRRNELITLTIDNVDLKQGVIKVYGKGRKEREIGMGSKMTKNLHFYLNRWRKDKQGQLVFCTREGRKLDKDNTRQIIWRMGQKVGVKINPHKIRHSAATWFIRNGGSPPILQRILGHSSPVITDKYTHLNITDITRSYQQISPGNSISV